MVKIDSDLELHLFQEHHAKELFLLVETNRTHLRKWLPWVDGMIFPEHFLAAIKRWEQLYYERRGVYMGIRYRNELIGSINLHGIDWSNSQASMGYYLAKTLQGKGIMYKAAKGMIRIAFHDLGLNRVEIRCGKKNTKSQAIPSKLGFHAEGMIRDGEYLNGHFHDLIVYGLLAREWHF